MKGSFMKKMFFLMLCFSNYSTAYAAYDGQCATLQDLVDLPPSHWCEVPNSNAIQVEKKPSEWDDWNGVSSDKYNSYQRFMGFPALLNNWNGGAFDSKRDRLLLSGGGHNGYGGNEVIAFDIPSLKWIRLSDPTAYPNRANTSYKNPDGTPITRHTYGGLEYIESHDRFFVFGGAPDNDVGVSGIRGTWLLDLNRLASNGYSPSLWKEGTAVNEPPSRVDDNAVYDPVSGKVYYHYGPSTSGWGAYDFANDQWERLNFLGTGNGVRTVIPGNRRFIVEFGKNRVNGIIKWDLTQATLPKTVTATTGDKAMEGADDPGAAYDWVADRIVAWDGGTDVYALNVDNNQWSKMSAAASNKADPGPVEATGGVFGRFRYSKNLNVFVTVDSVTKNVYLYRFAPSSGFIIPKKPGGLNLSKEVQ